MVEIIIDHRIKKDSYRGVSTADQKTPNPEQLLQLSL